MQLSLKSCKHCGLEYQNRNADFCCHACSVIYAFLSKSQYVTAQLQPTSLDLEQLSEYAQNNQIKIYIDGIHCISCLKFVEGLPQKITQIKEAQYILSESTIVVEFSDISGVFYLTQLLDQIGYDYKLLKSDYNLSQIQKSELQNLLIGIGVSGFSAGNIMLLAIAVYAGAAQQTKVWFNWASFFLFLPIVFFSALPFYQGAIRSLKLKQISIDLPITIALLFGFVFSSLNLLNGIDELYFDSISSFIFLILLTRYLNKKMIFSHSFVPTASDLLPEKQYQIERSGKIMSVLASQIQSHDIVTIPQNKRIPVDGVLISDSAEFNTSFITGETFSKEYKKNMNVFAGFESLQDNVKITATHSLYQSSLYKSFDKIKNSLNQKTQVSQLVDKISQILLLTVLAAGLLTFIILPNAIGAQRFLALMIVACPCALAFGAPLAIYKGVKDSLNKGIIIRSANVFEKYNPTLPIYFDKTGTLTKATLQITKIEPQNISDQNIAILLALENISQHPIAQSIRNHFKGTNPIVLQEACEIKSLGVIGNSKQDQFKFIQNKDLNTSGQIICDFIKNDKLIHRFYFKDQLSDGASEVMNYLKDKMTVLSGDSIDNLKVFAQDNNLKSTQCLGALKPEQKAEIVKIHKSIFIGDGVNDTLALASSHIGIAVRGSFEASLNACDVYIQNQDLRTILDFFKIAQNTYSTVKRNILISLLYNLVSGGFAIFGFINPLVAAVLMPVSSLAILGSTLFVHTNLESEVKFQNKKLILKKNNFLQKEDS